MDVILSRQETMHWKPGIVVVSTMPWLGDTVIMASFSPPPPPPPPPPPIYKKNPKILVIPESADVLAPDSGKTSADIVLAGRVHVYLGYYSLQTCISWSDKIIHNVQQNLAKYHATESVKTWQCYGHYTWTLSWSEVSDNSSGAPVNFIYRCPIFKWFAVTWL